MERPHGHPLAPGGRRSARRPAVAAVWLVVLWSLSGCAVMLPVSLADGATTTATDPGPAGATEEAATEEAGSEGAGDEAQQPPSPSATDAEPTTGDQPAPVESAPAAPDVVVRTEVVTKAITYRTVTQEDPRLDKGDKRVVREGTKGELELTFRVTYTDGVRTARELLRKRTLVRPVNRIVAVGTREPQPAGAACDPNYSGACVPIDSDVDCAGGSGNGPSYVDGPVLIVGDDIYDLDRDGDRVACE